MAQDHQDNELHDPFKPKTPASPAGAPQVPESDADQPAGEETDLQAEEAWLTPDFKLEGLAPAAGGLTSNVRTLATGVAGGFLLAALIAILIFAFSQFLGDDEPDKKGPETPPPIPTVVVIDPELVVPLVSSGDVRLPVALPKRLTIGDVGLVVQAVRTSAGTWPEVPATADSATWVYGTFVNYILAVAPTPENGNVIAGLRVGDALNLHMSTGVIFNFNVNAKRTATADVALLGEGGLFEQDIPSLTLVLMTEDPAQRTVVSANFFSDEAADLDVLAKASVGLFGTQVDQGQARVTVREAYQVVEAAAGLPPGAGYLLVDVEVENVGTLTLEPTSFQTFLIDTAGTRYLPTVRAERFGHHPVPAEALGQGQRLVGSFGYLIAGSPEGQFQWLFNPLPTSDHWVAVPLAFDLPAPVPTRQVTAGSARVTLDASDVFVNRDAGLLDITLTIENVSAGVVQVMPEDVSLNSSADGQLTLLAPAPAFPWVVEPGQVELFQLQFRLPTAESALLDVLGYTFSIEHLGGQ